MTGSTNQISTATKRKSGGRTNALLAGAVLLAIGGIAFAGGRATASSTAAAGFTAGGQGFPTGSFAPNGAPDGGSAAMTIEGTVASVDGSTMTITTDNGTKVTLDTSGATYHTQSAGSSSDVQAGSTVQVAVDGAGVGPGGADGGATASGAPAGGSGAETGSMTATEVTVTSGQ